MIAAARRSPTQNSTRSAWFRVAAIPVATCKSRRISWAHMIQSEYKIHVAIVEHLRSAFPDLVLTHAAHGRDETHAHFLSKMGYEAGTGDVIWYGCSSFGELEIKAFTRQSGNQKTRQTKVQLAGGNYAIVRSVREAHDYFVELGFKPLHAAIREPDIRTDEEKKRDAFLLNMPPGRR